MPASIYIIEGILGSGKDTLARELLHVLHGDTRPVYYYPEEALGFHYNQVFWPGISYLRLSLVETALDFVEQESERLPGVAFVFNRFHVTLNATVSHIPDDPDLVKRYEQVIERLCRMDVLVLLLQLEEHLIPTHLHHERAEEDPMWKQFLQRAVDQSPYTTPEKLWAAQQERINRIVMEQGLPYHAGSLIELLGFAARL